ncbi:MAG: hypothetical protein ACK52I_09310, partial [Pseudomonadota bacterium]
MKSANILAAPDVIELSALQRPEGRLNTLPVCRRQVCRNRWRPCTALKPKHKLIKAIGAQSRNGSLHRQCLS